jgi:phosphatidylglycerophosphate synthase
MLDTHGRKYFQPIIEKTADGLLKLGLTANQATVIGFAIGAFTGVFIYFDLPYIAAFLLWLSGFLDAVDGSMARKTRPSAWGTLLDVGFDRLVEISVILGLAFRYLESMWVLLLLRVSIIYAMTVFLIVGALSEKKGIKSFYYQAGLAERSEGFILFTLMILISDHLTFITLIFLIIEVFTTLQRLLEAKKLLR